MLIFTKILASVENRTHVRFTANERKMIVHVYQWFKGDTDASISHQKLKLRKRVALCLGISESSLDKVLSDFYRANSQINNPEVPLGRPHINPNDIDMLQLENQLRELVLAGNISGTPVSVPTLQHQLAERGFHLAKSTLTRRLKCFGFKWGKGEGRDILHETAANVAFRCRYIRRRFENLNANRMPVVPEIFLDESFVHLHHLRDWTWTTKGGVVYRKGRSPMLVMFGAIAVYRNWSSNQLLGELVPKSLLIWDPRHKQPRHTTRRRGRPLAAANKLVVPDVVRQADLVPDQVDYHGNFNADIFEDLFEKLCIQVCWR